MTCALDVYLRSGLLKNTGDVTLSTGAGDRNTSMASGVSGKIIVPIWFVISATGGSAELIFSLRGTETADANRKNQIIDNMNINATYFHTLFFNFGGRNINTLIDGEGIRVTLWDGTSATLTYARATMGYYLVDAS